MLQVAGREVVITNPGKAFFPQAGHTKLDLVRYYAAVAEGALRGIAGRPIVLKRYVDGADGEPVRTILAHLGHSGVAEPPGPAPPAPIAIGSPRHSPPRSTLAGAPLRPHGRSLTARR